MRFGGRLGKSLGVHKEGQINRSFELMTFQLHSRRRNAYMGFHCVIKIERQPEAKRENYSSTGYPNDCLLRCTCRSTQMIVLQYNLRRESVE
jgi:hypothetical protein